ncbi:MAG: arginine--tRNA ligase [Candidatus Izemoplasma sp.]
MKLHELTEKIKKELSNVLLKLEYSDLVDDIILETPKEKTNGDYSTNLAMKLAKPLRKNPFIIAEEIMNNINKEGLFIEKLVLARPGFINFFLDKSFLLETINEINDLKEDYGNLTIGKNDHYNIEFVSVNPTGSLHIGHCRGAAAGDSISRILKKAGFKVTKEYYLNDGGNQIHNLALSVDARYKQLFDLDAKIPEDGYNGPEIIEVAKALKAEFGDTLLTKDSYDFIKKYSVENLLDSLKEDLDSFGVEFDVWFREKQLYDNNEVDNVVKFLKENNFTYEFEGAIWLKTSMFDDEKDRVIVKSDGTYTYITPDIAYHKNKLSRGYTKLIDILGGDHHGYIDRLKASIEMIGGKSDLLEVEILQMVKVIQDGKEVKMSKRSGKAITLRDILEDVGPDPIRYFFAARSLNTQMDLDLDLALKQTSENPVYYAQYAHARINSIFNAAVTKGFDMTNLPTTFKTINSVKAYDLITQLAEYERVIESAALKRQPHRIANYINQLATKFHSFYNDEIVLSDDSVSTYERLALLNATKIVLKDSLNLIGVSAPNKM